MKIDKSITSYFRSESVSGAVSLNKKQKRVTAPSELCDDIFYEILSFLPGKDLVKCSLVNRDWYKITSLNDNRLWDDVVHREKAFGKKQWTKYFGEIDDEPPLPRGIFRLLQKSCLTEKGKKISQTHSLVLIPKSIRNEPLSLSSWEKLIGHPPTEVGLCQTSIAKLWGTIMTNYGTEQVPNVQWILMMNHSLDKSRGQSYEKQEKIVEELSNEAKLYYRTPTILEAAICTVVKKIESERHGFEYKPSGFTRCVEKINAFQVHVGELSKDLFCIDYYLTNTDSIGIAPLVDISQNLLQPQIVNQKIEVKRIKK